MRAAALLDDGRLVLQTELGPGVVDDRDLRWLLSAMVDRRGKPLAEATLERWLAGDGEAGLAADRVGVAGGVVPLSRTGAAQLGDRFGFEPHPTADR